MFSYGYLLASLPSYRNSHVQNACARLLVYLRDISHYQGEPSVNHRDEGGAGEGERTERLFFFLFIRSRCVGTHRCARAHTHLIQTGDLNTHENLHSCTSCRVDRDSSVGPRNCRQPDAALPTTSGPRIRSCKHLPFAQSASEANAPRSVVKTGVSCVMNALSTKGIFLIKPTRDISYKICLTKIYRVCY